MGMMDQTFVNALLTNLYKTTSNTVITGGTGGTTQTVTVPFKLRLYGTAGSETATGTELSTANGYTAGGVAQTTASPLAGTVSGAIFSNASVFTWTFTGTISTVNGIEIWDSSGTPVRHLWGSVTAITGLASGDTLQYPAGSVTANASNW